MKQVLQNLKDGSVEVIDAPSPGVRSGHALIDTRVTLVSAGTERSLIDFGRAGFVGKARKQPEKVKQVLQKVQTDGLLVTVDAVRSKLAAPLPLGYCNVGTVRESAIEGLKPGQRVLSNGPHADVVCVPKNLIAKVPDNVSDEDATFTVMGAIALQGVRLANPTLGETVVVVGAGVIGLLAIQLLIANGCRVLATDFSAERLELAKSFGAEICNPGAGEDPVAAGLAMSSGAGVDAVLITASTSSSEPVSQAAQMSRKRGRIVLVGVTGLELNRSEFYEKELSFQVSCSYGPGRYDSEYEAKGNDYPIGFVRWTEQRNFDAILQLMSDGRLNVGSLITHRFAFEDASSAYKTLGDDKSAMGIMLQYDHDIAARHKTNVALGGEPKTFESSKPVVAFMGAGNYASRVLAPAFVAANAQMHTMSSRGGTSSVVSGRNAGFAEATSDNKSILENKEINTVAIVTQHNSHAELSVDALKSGKNVFVEKPLALTREQLGSVAKAYKDGSSQLMVGFNRRFAPHVVKMKSLLDVVKEPKSFVMTMNAGAIPADHWTQDIDAGGGRIIGEACHYIDLMRFLAGSEIVSVYARRIGDVESVSVSEDKAVIVLGFADGSFGSINYLANGGASFPKERIEVFTAGRTLQIDNFISMRGFNWAGFKKMRLMRQDKGQNACVAAFLKAIEGGKASPIAAAELFEVAEKTIEAAEMLRSQT